MAAGHVKFGIRLLDDLGGARELVALAQHAERLGFDTLWFPHDKFRLNSWVLNAAVAQTTSRIELFARTNVYTTDPSEIASFIATLDEIAQGRASLTLGLHNFDTITWVGMNGDDVLERVREATDIVRRLLRGEVVPYRGQIYRWTEKAYLRVKPYRADVPILICPVGEEFLELSGEIGDGTLPMVTPPESAELIMASVKRGLQRSHDPNRPFDACAFVWMAISEDRDEARNMLADVVAYFGTYLDPRALGVLGLTVNDLRPAYSRIMARDHEGARAALTPEMLRTGIYGTPEECARQLEVVIRAGFNHISIGGPLGRDPAEAMRLIADRVIPHFRSEAPRA
jgi:5,10-methylenetetrahydromethanopterin reductase